MTERVLTADLGNSAVKLTAWDLASGAPRPGAQRRVAWGEALRRALDELGSAERVLACQVAGPARWAEFEAACAEGGLPEPREPRLDLGVSCRDLHTIGRDRLFAARGAWELFGTPAVVVDAGTALTVDALGLVDGAPSFLGGAIAPGPALLARALAGGAAQLFEVEPRPDAAALGQDSREALVAGVSVGFQGAAKELVSRVSTEAGLEGAPIALTGGAAEFLAWAFPARAVRREPELVALGLLAADAAERRS
jgi:type III pantothenate kinase